MEFCIFERSQQFNSYKTVRDFTKYPWTIFGMFLVHYTNQWLNFVVYYLNVKINWKLVDKIMHSFEVHSNENACRKSGCLGLDQFLRGIIQVNPSCTTDGNCMRVEEMESKLLKLDLKIEKTSNAIIMKCRLIML